MWQGETLHPPLAVFAGEHCREPGIAVQSTQTYIVHTQCGRGGCKTPSKAINEGQWLFHFVFKVRPDISPAKTMPVAAQGPSLLWHLKEVLFAILNDTERKGEKCRLQLKQGFKCQQRKLALTLVT